MTVSLLCLNRTIVIVHSYYRTHRLAPTFGWALPYRSLQARSSSRRKFGTLRYLFAPFLYPKSALRASCEPTLWLTITRPTLGSCRSRARSRSRARTRLTYGDRLAGQGQTVGARRPDPHTPEVHSSRGRAPLSDWRGQGQGQKILNL